MLRTGCGNFSLNFRNPLLFNSRFLPKATLIIVFYFSYFSAARQTFLCKVKYFFDKKRFDCIVLGRHFCWLCLSYHICFAC